jgi:enoyl-CoA hydratase/carnithine racemase
MIDTEEGVVEIEKLGPVGIITFDNLKKHNAITVQMWLQLSDAIDDMDADRQIRAVVIRGAGHKAFVSGGDISQFDKTRSDYETQQRYLARMTSGRTAIARCSKPTIASIRGYCLGGGLRIAMQADIRLAADDSRFGIPAVKLGLAYGFEGLQGLTALVGPANAKMLMLTGEPVDAQEALRMGLVNRVVPADQLWEQALGLAQTIAQRAPLSVAAANEGIDQALLDPGKRNLEKLEEMGRACMNSEDYLEGRTAFREKRPPNFTGR